MNDILEATQEEAGYIMATMRTPGWQYIEQKINNQIRALQPRAMQEGEAASAARAKLRIYTEFMNFLYNTAQSSEQIIADRA